MGEKKESATKSLIPEVCSNAMMGAARAHAHGTNTHQSLNKLTPAGCAPKKHCWECRQIAKKSEVCWIKR